MPATVRQGTLCLVWLVVAAAQGGPATEPPFALFAASDAMRVFEDGHGWNADAPRAITLSGLRNEFVSAQCVIQARAALAQVTVSTGALQHQAGTAVIPADSVRWRFVGGITIEQNTPKLIKADLDRSAPARFPDVLVEDSTVGVAAGALKAVYLTVRIPSAAPAGEYRGDVTVAAGGTTATLPLVLTVYPLTLPDERHLLVTEWFTTRGFGPHHGVASSDPAAFDRMLRIYAENMAEHRQNVFRVPLELIGSTLAADGTLRCDFSRFDGFAQVFWDTGRMDALETGFVATFGPERWRSREVGLKDFPVKDEASGASRSLPGRDFLPRFLPHFIRHLREKGWLERTLFHICDETSNHNVLAWREASRFVHQLAPELRRMDAIETPHLGGDLEVWVPKLDHLAAWEGAYGSARRSGAELWFYTVGIYQAGTLPNKTVDVPLIESRLLHWLNYRYRLSGYLHWGFNQWTDDPVNAPGLHRGDGWHVYPKRGGLLDSLRWEQMRAGLQDYECLWLLEEGIKRLRANLSPRVAELIDPARRGIEIARRVVPSYSERALDPAVLYAARQQVIAETLELDRPPRVVLQTNPPEHSLLANNSAVDVHGWAEPGTRIRINGTEAPLANDGLFLHDVHAAKDGTVTLEAELGGTRKRLVRHFRLLVPARAER